MPKIELENGRNTVTLEVKFFGHSGLSRCVLFSVLDSDGSWLADINADASELGIDYESLSGKEAAAALKTHESFIRLPEVIQSHVETSGESYREYLCRSTICLNHEEPKIEIQKPG